MDLTYIIQMSLNATVAGLIYSLVALGFTLIFGIARVLNFAHGEIYMVGAFFAFYFIAKLGVPYFPGVFFAALLMAMIGVIFERILFRPIRLARPFDMGTATEFPTVVVTLALALIIPALAVVTFGTTEKGISSGISGVVTLGPIMMSKERLVISFIALIMFIALVLFIRFHKQGRALDAVAQDRVAALLQGINLHRAAAYSFAIGFGLAGMAGGLLGPLYYVDPTMGPSALMKTFIVVILGGIGSVPGTLLGGLLFGFIEVFGRVFLGGNLPMLISFAVVMILLIVKPTGLLGHD